jgi:hypothetical protein
MKTVSYLLCTGGVALIIATVALSSGTNNVFPIHDVCSIDRTECVNVSGVWVPTGLKVRDGSKVYTLDTGSFQTVLTHCGSLPLSGSNDSIGYLSQTVVNQASNVSIDLMSVEVFPLCNLVGFGPSKNDGLVGMSLRLNGKPPYNATSINPDAPHSWMNARGAGDRVFVVDKGEGTVCFGSACTVPGDIEYRPFVPINSLAMLPAFRQNGTHYVLDTGSTDSIGIGVGDCLIGNHEIHALHIDYDRATIGFRVDFARANRRCQTQL